MNKVHFFCRLFCHCDGENKKAHRVRNIVNRISPSANTDGGLCRTRTHDQSVMSAPL